MISQISLIKKMLGTRFSFAVCVSHFIGLFWLREKVEDFLTSYNTWMFLEIVHIFALISCQLHQLLYNVISAAVGSLDVSRRWSILDTRGGSSLTDIGSASCSSLGASLSFSVPLFPIPHDLPVDTLTVLALLLLVVHHESPPPPTQVVQRLSQMPLAVHHKPVPLTHRNCLS